MREMQRLKLCLVLTLAIPFMGSTSAIAQHTALQLFVLDAKTVLVRGTGFSNDRFLVSADLDMPHASVACYTDFTRVALADSGMFEVALNPSKCDFSCGLEPSNFVVTVESLDGTKLAEAQFPCVVPCGKSNK